jgi:hypothetical protein
MDVASSMESFRERLGWRRIGGDSIGSAPHSEKTYGFSTLYMSVGNRRVDEFWDAGWMASSRPPEHAGALAACRF